MAIDSRKEHSFIIVGGGVSAAFTLKQLLKDFRKMADEGVHRDMLPLNIEVIEAGSEFCGGIAWSPDSARPFHSMNTYIPDRSAIELKEISRGNGDLEPLMMHKPLNEGEASRIFYGEVMKREMAQVIGNLKHFGVKVKLTPNTTVADIRKHGDGYRVIDDKGKHRDADFVLVASGHWQNKTGVTENPGVFASPWPASKLEKEIDSNQPIAIMGTSLSAVDAMLTLAHKAGSFKRDAGGHVHFKPKAGAGKFKLVAYSPHGMLPNVHGYESDKTKFSDLPKLHLMQDADGFISLDRFYDVMKQEFLERHVYPHAMTPPPLRAIENTLFDDQASLEDGVKLIYHKYRQQGPEGWLRERMEEAKESRETKTPIAWQHFMRSITGHLETAYNNFSAEDVDRFQRNVRPLASKIAFGMVISNAEEVLALLESGHLEVHALGEESSLGTKQKGKTKLPGAEIRYRDEDGKEHRDYYAAVVKASGDDPQRLRQSSPLMQNLFDHGMARGILAPFKDQALGKREYEREQATAGEAKTTCIEKDAYCRSLGGIHVNPATFQMLDADSHVQKGLFTVGPPVTGHLPLLQGFGAIDRGVETICETIEHSIMDQREQEYTRILIKPDELIEVLPLNSQLVMAIVTSKLSTREEAHVRDFVRRQLGVEGAIEITPASAIPADVMAHLRGQAKRGL